MTTPTEEKWTPETMADVLAAKLTDEEFMCLARLMDGDGQAGPLYCAVTDIAAQKHPEEFAPPEDEWALKPV